MSKDRVELYLDEYELFKNFLDNILPDKRKKDHSKVPTAFLQILSAYSEMDDKEVIKRWKGMIKLLDAGFGKKAFVESERELIAAILLLSAEIRLKKSS